MNNLVYRLRKRAEIRRQIHSRKSVQEGKSDHIADLLEEAAAEIERLNELLDDGLKRRLEKMNLLSEQEIADIVGERLSSMTALKGIVKKPDKPVPIEDMNILSTKNFNNLRAKMSPESRARAESKANLNKNKASVLAEAIQVFGDTEKAMLWLNQKNLALGKIPLSMLYTPTGVNEVLKVLSTIKSGGVV